IVLKLYGTSEPVGGTLAVAMTPVEKQVPFEMVPIDLANLNGAQKALAYLALQPFGQVPVIDDAGFIQSCTSRAICRYLAEKYSDQGTPLVPTDLRSQALFEQAASVEHSNFQPHALAIYVEGLWEPRKGLRKKQAVWDDAILQLSATLGVYEVILANQRFRGRCEI
ncbi:glutathione S-transferase, partial [Mycena latifolia]